MAETMKSPDTAAEKPVASSRQHGSLSRSIMARVLASGMALTGVMEGCASEEDVTISFSSVGADGTYGEVGLSQDATAINASDDVTTTTDSAATADMAGDASVTTDVADAVDTATEATPDAGTAADSTMNETSGTETADTKATSKPDVESSETTPSSPKQICEAEKAAIIATLKPGAPECTGTIPGVGKVAGELICDGTNLEPNCIIK